MKLESCSKTCICYVFCDVSKKMTTFWTWLKLIRSWDLWSCDLVLFFFFLRSWALNRRPVGWCLDKCLAFCSGHISSIIYSSSNITWSIVTYICVNFVKVWWTRGKLEIQLSSKCYMLYQAVWLSYRSIKGIRKWGLHKY